MKYTISSFLMVVLLAACSPGQVPASTMRATETPPVSNPAVEAKPQIVSTAVTMTQPAPTATSLALDATDWKNWNVIPVLAPQMLDVYANGQTLGRDVRVVSVVGDCESSSDWFLKEFSKGKRYYDLGPYADLQETIDHFNPSLGYKSYAALRGATASTVLTPFWADREACESNETPLACEYRVHNPAFAFIALGTNDIHKIEQFEPKMRQIIEYTLEQGIVPILATKADNLEGDNQINNTIAQLAVEYHLPVWNFWAAVQPLPGHGLQPDGAHLTFGSNFFNDPKSLEDAWAVRNLTALQVLESMRSAVQE